MTVVSFAAISPEVFVSIEALLSKVVNIDVFGKKSISNIANLSLVIALQH